MIIKGKDILLYVQIDGELVEFGFSTECSLNISTDFVETSSFATGTAKSVRPGRYSWSANCSCLIDDNDNVRRAIMDAILHRRRIYVSLSVGIDTYRGYAYIQSLDLSAAMNALGGYSLSIIGDGPLEV